MMSADSALAIACAWLLRTTERYLASAQSTGRAIKPGFLASSYRKQGNLLTYALLTKRLHKQDSLLINRYNC